MSKPVRTAFRSKLAADSVLTNLLGDGADSIAHAVADDDTDYPLVIFNKQGGTRRFVFQGVAFFQEIWLVKGVARNDSSRADEIATRIDSLLNLGTLTISGKTFMSLMHNSDVEYPEKDGDQIYRHAGATYRLRYQG